MKALTWCHPRIARLSPIDISEMMSKRTWERKRAQLDASEISKTDTAHYAT